MVINDKMLQSWVNMLAYNLAINTIDSILEVTLKMH